MGRTSAKSVSEARRRDFKTPAMEGGAKAPSSFLSSLTGEDLQRLAHAVRVVLTSTTADPARIPINSRPKIEVNAPPYKQRLQMIDAELRALLGRQLAFQEYLDLSREVAGPSPPAKPLEGMDELLSSIEDLVKQSHILLGETVSKF